jgi:iron complex outermembrane receptor protein
VFDRTYAEHLSRSGAMVPGYLQTTRVNEPGQTLWMKVNLTY